MQPESLLGRGVIAPFVRAGSDFIYKEGAALVEAALKQILKTKRGELPWRPNFGLDLEQYRHQGTTDELLAAVESEVERALAVDPRIQVLDVLAEKETVDGTKIIIRVSWQSVAQSSTQSTVLTDPQTSVVRI